MGDFGPIDFPREFESDLNGVVGAVVEKQGASGLSPGNPAQTQDSLGYANVDCNWGR